VAKGSGGVMRKSTEEKKKKKEKKKKGFWAKSGGMRYTMGRCLEGHYGKKTRITSLESEENSQRVDLRRGGGF